MEELSEAAQLVIQKYCQEAGSGKYAPLCAVGSVLPWSNPTLADFELLAQVRSCHAAVLRSRSSGRRLQQQGALGSAQSLHACLPFTLSTSHPLIVSMSQQCQTHLQYAHGTTASEIQWSRVRVLDVSGALMALRATPPSAKRWQGY